MLVKYIRKNGKPVACVVAIDAGAVGYSCCNPNDNFDKVIGRHIAIGRAGVPVTPEFDICAFDNVQKRVPHDLLSDMFDEISRMDERSRIYYKS